MRRDTEVSGAGPTEMGAVSRAPKSVMTSWRAILLDARLAVVPLSTAAAGFVTSVAIARVFGPAGRGEYAVAITIVMTSAQVTSWGLGESLAIHMTRVGGPPRPRRWLLRVWGVYG